jgi:hypothetical protein
VIFRCTSSTSKKPAVIAQRREQRSPVGNQPDDATSAVAIVAARANLLVSKASMTPSHGDQFDLFLTSLSLARLEESMFREAFNDI